ncbi:MAG TPA: hypothetical protein VFV87_21300, partial [Pirellulaceae bacterium]|nr:hypothetical protein [Pirellulaceae bacterium]
MGFRIADCGLRIAEGLFAAAILCAVPVIALAEETEAERAERLKNMTLEQKDAVLNKQDRFEKLSAEEQERLRALHVSIESAPNGTELRQTLSRYHAWLATLTSIQRSELLTLPADERIVRIKELLKQQESQRFQAFVGNLPPEDHTAIFNWLGEFVAEHEAEILAQLDFSERGRVRNAPDREAKNRLLALYMAAKRQNPKMPMPSVDDLNRLMERVSTEATRQIEQAPADQQPERIREMVRAAIFSRRLPPVNDEELQKFY